MLDPVWAIPVGKPRTESDPKEREFSPGTARAAALQGSWSPLQGQGQVTERPEKPCAESSRNFPPSPQSLRGCSAKGEQLKEGRLPGLSPGGQGGHLCGRTQCTLPVCDASVSPPAATYTPARAVI